MRAAAYELRMVKDEMQITKEELKTARGELRVVKVGQQADKEELRRLGTGCVSRQRP